MISNKIKEYFRNIESKDDTIRLNSLNMILKETEKKVDRIYEVWDTLIEKMDNENSYQRSIGILILCNLAKSDRDNRFNDIIGQILDHTADDKFITSRQCIQHCWKIAIVNDKVKQKIVEHLEELYIHCMNRKHYNLLRQDIIKSLFELYKQCSDEKIHKQLITLIDIERDNKNRKKYYDIINIE